MRNSFLIMMNWAATLAELDDVTAGKVIKAVCEYQTTGNITTDDPIVKAIFAGWKAQMDANNEAYDETCKARAEAGRKGAEARWQNSKAIANDGKGMANDSKRILLDGKHMAKMADNDTDNDTVLPKGNISIVEQARPSIESDIDDIIDYLNRATQSNFKKTTDAYRKTIRARLNDGYTLDDFKRVIDSRVSLWGNDDRMREYLRPQTLFAPSHFDAYLNEANRPRPSNPPKPIQTGGAQKNNPFNNYEQNHYTDEELDELERLLTVN